MTRRLLLLLLAFSFLGFAYPAWAQEETPTPEPPGVAITSPVGGQALQGSVSILGDSDVEGFQSVELSFSYAQDTTSSWFLITESDQPVADGELAQWDTTTITDGEYDLRLVVLTADGDQASVMVPNLRVRNYTPIETDTPVVEPTAVTTAETPAPTGTDTPTVTPVPPTATPLPPNPAEIGAQDITLSLGKGVLATLGAFLVIGLYASIRRFLRR